MTANNCSEFSKIVLLRRQSDLAATLVALLFSMLHLIVLLYLIVVRKVKCYDYLLAISVTSILALVALGSVAPFDLCLLPQPDSYIFYRGKIWLFLNNALISSYGFMVVLLCFDKFMALYRPVTYGHVFVRRKNRLLLVLSCFAMGSITCLKWFCFDPTMQTQNCQTNAFWFYLLKTVSSLVQYFVCGVLMLVFSAKSVKKLRKLNRIHRSRLRINGPAQRNWHQVHERSVKIGKALAIRYALCLFLSWNTKHLKEENSKNSEKLALLIFFLGRATYYSGSDVHSRGGQHSYGSHENFPITRLLDIQIDYYLSFCLLNWPFGIMDWLYTDELQEQAAFSIAGAVVNIFQIAYLKLNIFLFAYNKKLYRETLVYLLTFPCRCATKACKKSSTDAATIPSVSSTVPICTNLETEDNHPSEATYL